MISLFAKRLPYPKNGRRALSNLVSLSVNENTRIAKVEMNNLPVNSLSTKLMEDLLSAVDEAKAKNCRGMIITSGANNVFSAGLNLVEVHKAEMNAFRKFYYLFQELNLQLCQTPFLTAAAIPGHAIAGGCVMALTTDYRVMVNNPEKPYRIGINETAIGMAAPAWIQQLMGDVIGRRQTIQALLSSTLFTTEEAFKIGLIDEMAHSPGDALEKADAYLTMFQDLPDYALRETKGISRKEWISKFTSEREFDLINFSKLALSSPTQDKLGSFLNKK